MANHTLTAHSHTHAHGAAHHHDSHGGPKLYAMILGALLVLTVITVAASRVDFGSINVIVAMLIASVKASLVALFFMHLRWDKPMGAIIFVASLFFLALFLIGCYTDTASRPALEPTNLKAPQAAPAPGTTPQNGQQAPGVGHGQPGAMSPSGGGPAIPGASPEGSHGGAATGDILKTPAPQ